MPVIDVDSHFEPGGGWLEPFPELAARLPQVEPQRMILGAIAHDILRWVPPAQWPPASEVVTPAMKALLEGADPADVEPELAGKDHFARADAATRVAFCDAQGIDVQNVICAEPFTTTYGLEDRALIRDLYRASNTWLADTIGDHGDRLLPVANMDFTDLDWAIAELTRMRARGSRIYLLPGEPQNGLPQCHPEWDRVWAASVDLGMVPMLHIGLNPAHFHPGWANTGQDHTTMLMIGNSQHHQSAQILISAMIYGGVFERFPTLTLMLAEVGIGWLPFFRDSLDEKDSVQSRIFMGPWRHPLRPSEYLERNVRATPLPRASEKLLPVMEQVGSELLMFSSDYNHFEGSTTPLAYYDALLPADAKLRERFFGGTAGDVFARMGDPIAA